MCLSNLHDKFSSNLLDIFSGSVGIGLSDYINPGTNSSVSIELNKMLLRVELNNSVSCKIIDEPISTLVKSTVIFCGATGVPKESDIYIINTYIFIIINITGYW